MLTVAKSLAVPATHTRIPGPCKLPLRSFISSRCASRPHTSTSSTSSTSQHLLRFFLFQFQLFHVLACLLSLEHRFASLRRRRILATTVTTTLTTIAAAPSATQLHPSFLQYSRTLLMCTAASTRLSFINRNFTTTSFQLPTATRPLRSPISSYSRPPYHRVLDDNREPESAPHCQAFRPRSSRDSSPILSQTEQQIPRAHRILPANN